MYKREFFILLPRNDDISRKKLENIFRTASNVYAKEIFGPDSDVFTPPSLPSSLRGGTESDKNFDYLNPEASSSFAPHKIFNIGNSNPVPLMEYVYALEKSLGKQSIKEFTHMQPGDVVSTSAKACRVVCT